MDREVGQDARSFYDARYAHGYMDEWPDEKKERVLRLIRSLRLPDRGRALDLGCGNGEFTGILKKALPGWSIYGSDISSVAVENARMRCPDCSFFIIGGSEPDEKFDFLFTHHVLEHADNIQEIWVEIHRYLRTPGSVLHILPCGHKGSLEYNLCMLKADGIDRDSGNRFYFEDKGHLRRLTAKQVNDCAIKYDLVLSEEFYSNQFYGALNWITLEAFGFIMHLTALRNTKDIVSSVQMILLRASLLAIKFLRFPANTIDHKRNKMGKYQYALLFFVLLPVYPVSKLTNMLLKYWSNREWEHKRKEKNGSEMFLYYARA
ncbi:MAG: class I SAM-dependent methyltransferase [Candidatus Omnitrophica bacterium]|nr:class I SAM-dependent methyltransferase [Candidatus Omnitrophota bacterium]